MKKHVYTLKQLLFCALLFAGPLHTSAQCNVPGTLTITPRSCDSISVSWPAAAGALSYIYNVVTQATPPAAGSLAATNSLEQGGLTPGTLYYVHVRTNCTGTVSAWKTDTIRTCGTPPTVACAVPGNILVSNLTTNSCTFSWSAVSGAVGYEYVLDQSGNTPTATPTATTATSLSFTGLTPGVMYYLHLRAQCGPTTYSSWAMGFVTTYGAAQCDPPASVTVTNPACDSAKFDWTAVPGVILYQYAVTQSSTVPATFTNATSNTAKRGALSPSTTYYVHIRALCSSPGTGISNVLTKAFTTPSCGGTGCAAPATVNNSSVTSTTASVAWSPVSGAIGYEHVLDQLTTDPAGSGALVTATTASYTALTPNTSYYLHVRSKCGTSTFSAWKPASLVKTAQQTAVGNTGAIAGNMEVYPSPAGSFITVTLGHTPMAGTTLTIFGIDGRKVKSVSPASATTVDVQDLRSGLYLLECIEDGRRQVVRFAKD